MKIAICDDETKCLEKARMLTEKYILSKDGKKISFDDFTHPEDLISACEKNGGYDIYILDIVMPDINGIELGETLRNMGFDGKIIYLTSSEEYSLDAFRVKAFDYLIKPINETSFFKALDEVMAQISQKQDRFTVVKTKDRSIRINFDSILFAELSKRSIYYYLTDGRVLQSVTLRTTFPEAMTELTSDNRFSLCGQSMLVNLDYITEIENDGIVFKNNKKAHLGEKNCRKLRSIWSSYLFELEG